MRIDQHITWVYTTDLEDTCRFYDTILGFEIIRDEGGARIFHVTPASAIGVCKALPGRIVQPDGSMISLVTADVDAWYDRLARHKATLRGAPERLEEFGIYGFFAEDPNGYVIEFQKFLD